MFVVDTNVGIVANGASDAADLECRLACVEELEWLRDEGTVAVDDKLLVFDEYSKHLSLAGQPGVGDAFLKHIYDEQYKEDRVRRFEITPSDDEGRGFDELPENSFDPSDRKFLAVAVVANAVLVNAADGDWGEARQLMDDLQVEVKELCPHLPQIRASTQ